MQLVGGPAGATASASTVRSSVRAAAARSADGQPGAALAEVELERLLRLQVGAVDQADRQPGCRGAPSPRGRGREAAASSRSGSGGSHGRCGSGRPSAAACAATARAQPGQIGRPPARVRAGLADARPPAGQRRTADRRRPAAGASGRRLGHPRDLERRPECRCRTGGRPRPGRSTGRCAASAVPRTSRESASSVVRRQIRRVQLARISGETTPLGRWVARTRCTPSDRPRWAMRDQAGDEGRAVPRPGWRTRRPRSPAGRARRRPAGPRCRRRRARPASARAGSARRASERSARAVVWPSRSVTTPTVCGRRGRLGERRAALVVDQQEGAAVRRVRAAPGRRSGSAAAPTCPTRWCPRPGRAGPSRHRSTCDRPVGRAAQGREQPVAVAWPTPRRAARRVSRRRPAPGRSSSRTSGGQRARLRPPERGRPGRGRARRRSRRWQPVDRAHRAVGRPSRAQHGRRRPSRRPAAATRGDRRPAASSGASAAVSTSTPPSRAARRRRAERASERPVDHDHEPAAGGRRPGPSPSAATPLPASGRVSQRVQLSSSGAPTPGSAARTAPGGRWGSHRAHAQSRRRSASVSRSSSTSPGACRAASWATTAGSTPSAPLPGPDDGQPPPARRSTATGRSGGRHAARGCRRPSDPGDPRRARAAAHPDGERVGVAAGAGSTAGACAVGRRRRARPGPGGAPRPPARRPPAASASRPSRGASTSARVRRGSRRRGAPPRPPVRRPRCHRHQRAEQRRRTGTWACAAATAMSTPADRGQATATQARRRGGRRLGRPREGHLASRRAAGGIREIGRTQHAALRRSPCTAAGALRRAGDGQRAGAQAQDGARPARSAAAVEVTAVEPAAVGRPQVGDGDPTRGRPRRRRAAGTRRGRPAGCSASLPRPEHVAALAQWHGPARLGPADRRAAPGRSTARAPVASGPGRPGPRTAPWASSGAVSGRSSGSRERGRPQPGRPARPSAAASAGRTSPRRSLVPRGDLDVDARPRQRCSVQHAGRRGGRSERAEGGGHARHRGVAGTVTGPAVSGDPVDNAAACGQRRARCAADRPNVRRDRDGPGSEEDP